MNKRVKQGWLKVDSATAFHLIIRNADSRKEAGEMMAECINAHVQAALASQSQEPVGLVYNGQDGYGASLKQGLEHGAKLYTSPQPDLTERVKELEAKLDVAEADASRYQYLMGNLGANQYNGWTWKLPPLPENWMKGSVSQHFSKAIDQEIKLTGQIK